MSLTSRLKSMVKQAMTPQPKPLTEFEYATLPWIDKKDADIDSFVKRYQRGQNFPYDLADKLRFWQQNGYVILEKAIQEEWVDQLWNEVEELIAHHERYRTNVRIDRPEYAAQPVKEAKDVPTEVLDGPYIKIMDFHDNSVMGKKIMLHNSIVTFLEAVFSDRVVAMQSLLFKYGSQQATHQDFAYVVSENPSHLAAAWIALEDVHIDSGPLFYFPGSHKLRKFDFGNTGMFYSGESKHNPTDFARYLEKVCQEAGLKRETLLIKKGDVLLWHASLAHGGDAIRNPALTRKSYVCHYSSLKAYQHHRQAPTSEPIRRSMNGADVFANPQMPDQEDIFK
ncbi:phytanoyl-CoA dioxygenase [Fibrisoma montanum]|uniref:Phytanoyl-CoA dioxygenase n=1 Tax=Fibrisoma montanum TaxID=2305895 RepID=A0A418LYJ8_9BACT|nr:phytanoyl-CoA dioxygenase family protein [Fibrisoma montanum]RIV18453.1 phytanoyl-CoA dioxygenase [Fibrisoma montanum]